jgi:hypothetical protein
MKNKQVKPRQIQFMAEVAGITIVAAGNGQRVLT